AGRRHAQISDGAARAADARIHGARARAVGGARSLPAQRPVALARLWTGRLDRPLGDFRAPRRHRRLGADRPRDPRPSARRDHARVTRTLRRQAEEAVTPRPAHSICTPAVFTTVVHLSRSRARKAANSSGEVILASTPSFTSVDATSGDVRL